MKKLFSILIIIFLIISVFIGYSFYKQESKEIKEENKTTPKEEINNTTSFTTSFSIIGNNSWIVKKISLNETTEINISSYFYTNAENKPNFFAWYLINNKTEQIFHFLDISLGVTVGDVHFQSGNVNESYEGHTFEGSSETWAYWVSDLKYGEWYLVVQSTENFSVNVSFSKEIKILNEEKGEGVFAYKTTDFYADANIGISGINTVYNGEVKINIENNILCFYIVIGGLGAESGSIVLSYEGNENARRIYFVVSNGLVWADLEGEYEVPLLGDKSLWKFKIEGQLSEGLEVVLIGSEIKLV